MVAMRRIVHEGMDAGALGWSAQVFGVNSAQGDYDGTPMITDIIPDEELFSFAEVLAERRDGFVQLAQSSTKGGWNACERIAAIARRPVVYQVVQANDNNPAMHRDQLRWLQECAKKGLRVYGQGDLSRAENIWTFKDFTLWDSKPNWKPLFLGTHAQRKAKMMDEAHRAILRAEVDAGNGPPNMDKLCVNKVSRADLEHYVGQTVQDLAKKQRQHFVDTLLDLSLEDDLDTEFSYTRGGGGYGKGKDVPEYMAEVLGSPYVAAGLSDGSAHMKLHSSGQWATQLLIRMVREEELVSLEEAHHKFSYMPAFVGGIRDRGFIREGAPADIIVYDFENLRLGPDTVAYDLPAGDWRRVQKAEGYRWTLVNGRVTMEEGQPTGELPGKLLRHGMV